MRTPRELYSEGLFTTILVYDGSLRWKNEHLERLFKSAKEYFFLDSTNHLRQRVEKQLKKIDLTKNARVRLDIFPKQRQKLLKIRFTESDLIIEIKSSKLTNVKKTLKLKTENKSYDSRFSQFKFPNYSDSFYLKRKAIIDGYDDILFCDGEKVIEGSTSNIIFFDGSNWFTPSNGGYEGLTRQVLIEKGIVQQQELMLRDLKRFTSVGFINSISLYTPIQSIDGYDYAVNTGEDILRVLKE